MSMDLGYDLEESLKRRGHKISLKNIEAMRSALADSKLVPKTITNKQLALFLDASDGKVDVATKTVEIYYDARKHAPEHFALRDPKCDEIQQCLSNQIYFLLPAKDGCPIIYHQLANSKPTNYCFDNAIKTFFMSIDICLHKFGPERGIIFLFDMRNVRIGHLTRVRVGTIRKFFRYVQEGLPAKLCEIHVLNVVSFFDKILSLVKPFMRAEIFKVLHTYPPSYNMNEFHDKVIPRNCLPSDFGGDLPSIEVMHEQFKNEYYNLQDYFRAEEEQRGLYWDELKAKSNNSSNKKDHAHQSEIIQNFNKLDID